MRGASMATNSLSYSDVITRPSRVVGQPKLDLSVVIRTRNEAGNIELLLARIRNAFSGDSFADSAVEVIFVDDSTDETPRAVERAARSYRDLNVRLIHRPPEQRSNGLAGAVIKGLTAARSEYVCVMDGDLQHPPEMVPLLLRTAREKQADLVVATRRNVRSKITGLNLHRNLISR